MSTRLSQTVFEQFLDEVVGPMVLGEAERARVQTIGDGVRKKIDAGQRVDLRPAFLMTRSGKGGFTPDPNAWEVRRHFRNVSLLEHVMSVARGACVFAELDLRAHGLQDEDALRRRVATVVVVGFLHDADKMLDAPRALLTDAMVVQLVERYGIAGFLEKNGASRSPARLRGMIDAVENTRANRMSPGDVLLSADEVADCRYVRLADRLDGAFLDMRRGIDGVVEELSKASEMLRSRDVLTRWRRLRITSPHTPFLLDRLLEDFDFHAERLTGQPPLLSLHHDGELLLVASEEHFDAIFEASLADMERCFNTGMRLDVNPKGTRDILDGGTGIADLLEAIRHKQPDMGAKALFLRKTEILDEAFRAAVNELVDEAGFGADWSRLSGFAGSHYQPWRAPVDSTPITYREFFERAAAVTIALGCADPNDKALKARLPDADRRQEELVAALAEFAAVPAWILAIEHRLTRQTMLGVFAARVSHEYQDLEERLFRADGLLQLWLAGDGNGRSGLLHKFDNPGRKLAEAAQAWFRAAASRRFHRAEDEDAPGRCIFTNIPVSEAAKIESKTGLYGLKISAFSGRENRPEFFDTMVPQTLVSPIAQAEHRLRSLRNDGREGDVAVFLSSPSNSGLFASLNYGRSHTSESYSRYDMARAEVKPGMKVYQLDERRYRKRIIMGRYEEFPNKTVEQLAFVKMIMESALRLGRPIHVFRGSPHPHPAFVFFDTLPDTLRMAFGKTEFRIEELRPAAEFVRLLEEVAQTTGFGLEIASRIADPQTRFAGACDALTRLDRRADPAEQRLRSDIDTLIWKDTTMRQTSDDAVVRFAEAMTRVQRGLIPSDSNNVREFGIRTAIDAAASASGVGQVSRDSLKLAIVGTLRENMERSTHRLFASADARGGVGMDEAFKAAVDIFVDDIWFGVLRGREPDSQRRRIITAIYRAAFDQAVKNRRLAATLNA